MDGVLHHLAHVDSSTCPAVSRQASFSRLRCPFAHPVTAPAAHQCRRRRCHVAPAIGLRHISDSISHWTTALATHPLPGFSCRRASFPPQHPYRSRSEGWPSRPAGWRQSLCCDSCSDLFPRHRVAHSFAGPGTARHRWRRQRCCCCLAHRKLIGVHASQSVKSLPTSLSKRRLDQLHRPEVLREGGRKKDGCFGIAEAQLGSRSPKWPRAKSSWPLYFISSGLWSRCRLTKTVDRISADHRPLQLRVEPMPLDAVLVMLHQSKARPKFVSPWSRHNVSSRCCRRAPVACLRR